MGDFVRRQHAKRRRTKTRAMADCSSTTRVCTASMAASTSSRRADSSAQRRRRSYPADAVLYACFTDALAREYRLESEDARTESDVAYRICVYVRKPR